MNINPSEIFDQMPDFNSHEEARSWFKSKFNDQMILKMTDVADGKRIFYYHLIKDEETYQEYMTAINKEEGVNITSTKPFESYSTIEITEDGDVSFSL